MDYRDRIIVRKIASSASKGTPTYLQEMRTDPYVRKHMSSKTVSKRVVRLKKEGIIEGDKCPGDDTNPIPRIRLKVSDEVDMEEDERIRKIEALERIADALEEIAKRKEFPERETKVVKRD